jgi:hypothetical protein
MSPVSADTIRAKARIGHESTNSNQNRKESTRCKDSVTRKIRPTMAADARSRGETMVAPSSLSQRASRCGIRIMRYHIGIRIGPSSILHHAKAANRL